MRINACILNEIHLLMNDDTVSTTYLDFSGIHAYIVQLLKFESKFIYHEVASFSMIKYLMELGNLRASIINFYK
ncbi:hypothetical protein EDC94DRAFT_56664 [Helicostylum pulchrum]|nr:hypothetical protein EDC94DRAFT_56664 [Helicostylum pulchrum]